MTKWRKVVATYKQMEKWFEPSYYAENIEHTITDIEQ